MQFLKAKFPALLLAFAMLLSIIPANVFAAIEAPNWEERPDTTENNVWSLPGGARNRDVSTSEPWPLHEIHFDGSYVNADGRTVLRFAVRQNMKAGSTVWKTLNFHFDARLFPMIDWSRSYIRNGNNVPLPLQDTGRNNEKKITVEGGANLTANGVLPYNRYYPMEIVLNAGSSMETIQADIKDDLLVQMRVMNGAGNEVFSFQSGKETSYNTNTVSTVVPMLSKFQSDSIPDNYRNKVSDKLLGTNTIMNYNPSTGKLRIFYGYRKHDSLTTNFGQIGLKQMYDARFVDLLKEDADKNVGQVYITYYDYRPFFTDAKKYTKIKMSDFNKTEAGNPYVLFGESGFRTRDGEKRISVPTYRDYLIHGALLSDIPFYTCFEYHLDTEKVNEMFAKDEYLRNFLVRTETVASTIDSATGGATWSQYTFTVPEDVTIAKNDLIKLSTPAGLPKNTGLNLKIGDKNPMYYTYNGYEYVSKGTTDSAFELLTYDNLLNGKSDNYRVRLPEGMTLKRGTPITVYVNDTKTDISASKISLGGREFALNATKRDATNEVIIDRSWKTSALIFTKTKVLPKIDEIFTGETEVFTGYTAAPFMEVVARYNDVVYRQTSGDTAYVQNINGTDKDGYAFSVINSTNSEGKGPIPLKKDMPIAFKNYRQSSIPADAVVEQVQSRVTFDLNGGSLGGSKASVKKIAPLNENYSFDPNTGVANPAYVPSGFTGDITMKDHEGKELTGDALALRKFPGEPTLDEDNQFLGWSTKKLSTVEEIEAFRKAPTVEKIEDWQQVDNGTVYRFTATSPIDHERTVYAVYGSGFTIRLHRNAFVGDTVVYDIPVTKEIFLRDGGKVRLPYAYDNANNELEDFIVSQKSFLGWTAKQNDTAVDYNAPVVTADGNHLLDITAAQATESGRRILDGTTINFGTDLKAYNGTTIDLYGHYAPYVKIDASKTYAGEGVDPAAGAPIRVGLLYRTAISASDNPTVSEMAAYYTPEGALENDKKVYGGKAAADIAKTGTPKEAILKVYAPKTSPNPAQDLVWEVPGYDYHGDRLSYVIAELPHTDGDPTQNADAYYNFDQNWSSLGIAIGPNPDSPETYTKKQVFRNTDEAGQIDTFSGATSRAADFANTETGEQSILTKYSFSVTNTKLKAAAPIIEEMTDGDTAITLKDTVSDEITTIDLIVKANASDPGTTVTFEKFGDTWVQRVPDGAQKGFDLNYDPAAGIIGITKADGSEFVAGQEVAVRYHYGVDGDATTQSEYAYQTVREKEKSGAVIEMEQKPNQDNNAVITALRPTTGISLPVIGTEYVLADKDGNPILHEGKEIAVPFDSDNPVVEFRVPKELLTDGQEIRILSREPDKLPTISDESIRLDLAGPKIADASAIDGGYGMFIDLKAKFDDSLAPFEGVKILVGEENTEYIPAIYQLNPDAQGGYVLDFPRTIPRSADSASANPKIRIVAKDRLNNETSFDVPYQYADKTPSYTISQPRARKDYLSFSAVDAEKLQIIVHRNEEEIYRIVVDVENGKTMPLKVALHQKLERGDLIEIIASRGAVQAPERILLVR
ncbi:hypothetical protein QO008_001109 [Peptoniphilus ivorii]|uniref:hypothetical protein n=1 Tax=Aedoeadaptatus ivorii TaxID=54006 RepID=UPI002787C579|nr:hypothetical protein [Peptoniphilus ivorii]MDQ0508650.1 hypothetical protein [Peptoniphilus ivorii]